MPETATIEQVDTFTKTVRPGTIPTSGDRRVSVYCRIEWNGERKRLSISGVVGPTPGGNAAGGAGQIDMEFRHRNPEDDDRRYGDALIHPSAFNFADGWTTTLWLDFLDVWKVWHLNDMKAGCAHQRALGWTSYDEHPSEPCPECGYRYGSAWLHEDVPADVLAFLRSLPDTDKVPAWV